MSDSLEKKINEIDIQLAVILQAIGFMRDDIKRLEEKISSIKRRF